VLAGKLILPPLRLASLQSNSMGWDARESQDTWQLLLQLICFAVSGVMNAWVLVHVFGHPVHWRKQLLWIQLVALTIANLLCCIFGAIGWSFGIFLDNVPSDVLETVPSGVCEVFVFLIFWAEFTFALLQVHISLIFAVACWGQVKIGMGCFFTVPLCYILALAAVLSVHLQGSSVSKDDGSHCLATRGQSWGGIVLGCSGAMLVLHIAGSLRMVDKPDVVRRESLRRGVCFTLGFLFCFGPAGIVETCKITTSDAVATCLKCVIALNGAVHALTYNLRMRKIRQAQDLRLAESVTNAFEEERSTVSALEGIITDTSDLCIGECPSLHCVSCETSYRRATSVSLPTSETGSAQGMGSLSSSESSDQT